MKNSISNSSESNAPRSDAVDIVRKSKEEPSKQSSVFSYFATDAEKAGLRDIKIEKEPPVVIMPLDATPHSTYCLMFYMKYMHKPENRIHVCFVRQNYLPPKKSETAIETNDKKGWRCLVALRRLMSQPPRKSRSTMGPSPGMLKEIERMDKANYNMLKAEVRDVFGSNDVSFWDVKCIRGEDPWVAILEYSEEMKGTFIMLGSRGHGKLSRNIFGSVSDKVLHRSPIPVMVVRSPPDGHVNLIEGMSTIF